MRLWKDKQEKDSPNRPGQPGGKPPRSSIIRGLILWVAFFVLLSLFFKFTTSAEMKFASIPYSTFYGEVKKDNIESASISELTLRGEFRIPFTVDDKTYRGFVTTLPYEDEELMKEMLDKGVMLNVERPKFWKNAMPWIVMLLFVVFWIFMIRQMQSVPKGVSMFGKSKAKSVSENTPKVTFDDAAGVDEAKEELKEVIEFLKNPQKFTSLGARVPKGVLLVGPPGTGKTLLARAVAGEADVPFFSMSGSDFVELFVGVGASRVRDLFDKGKKSAPCIIFIDELDAVGRHRGAGIGGGHDEREQTLNALLVEMDGFEANKGVIVMAATNRPDVLDPALLRPGRFDRRVVVDRPDVKGREAIFGVHTRSIPLAKNVSLSTIARTTPGFSGADIANLVNEAALIAAKKGRNKVLKRDFEEARDKVLMGVERKSLVIKEDEKRNIAYHESGHALVAKYLKEADPIHKVSIVPRGLALGATQSLPVDDRHNFSKEYCKAQLASLLGGRAAEIEALDTLTTGAGNDIERATELARKMVCEWGMSEKLGAVTFGKKEEHIFLGREIGRHFDYSEETAREIDGEIRRFVEEAEKTARKIVNEHRAVLEMMVKKLLDKEVLTGEELNRVVEEVEEKEQTK
ncbi:cell division protein FtsH [candidate division WOR-3 bacterium JGI_Cruoil_03_44_89]|uniref:ATP-dependent zinc metalloprotease FtsH n=1 Tax=candidate division WOR-3 bacterium JGI_Cruoil_03_44_89 TaxID=1973748 RepID=A0A235BPL2_UNCW3|nr:MAG: cell division protein FtsH [candidate division WOR-3 bacterium JGI_Cruoil_03_44_89]